MTYRPPASYLLAALCLCSSLLCHNLSQAAETAAPTPTTAPPPSALVQIAAARPTQMNDSMMVYGTVEYAPEQSQVLSVQGDGIVSKVMVAAGQRVRKGEALLELAATANAHTESENARIAVSFADKDVQRLKGLRARQLATNLEVQTAEETLARAEATLANVQKREGDAALRVLRAESDGVVDQVNVHQGEIAAAGTPLIRLVKGDQLRVLLGVEAEDLPRLHESLPVNVAPLSPGARASKGRIQQIYRQIDPKTRLAQVVVSLPVAPGLLPGAVVRGEIILGQQSVLAVPRSAVLSRNGHSYVFVTKNSRAILTWVDTGRENADNVEIRRGLNAGDSVVTLGNYELEHGMQLRIQATPAQERAK